MLAVIALAVVSTYLANSGKSRYLWVTALPLVVVMTTTSTAAVQMFIAQTNTFTTQLSNGDNRNWTLFINSGVQGLLILAMLACAIIIIIAAAMKIWKTTDGFKSEGAAPSPGLEPVTAG
jgi:carbon starvation protein CstA